MSNYDLRDTEAQDQLRAQFRIKGKAGPTTACPCCLPNYKKKVLGWERGMCGELVAMKCNNCGYIRTSKPRDTPRHNGLTLGQERGMMRFKAKLERFVSSGSEPLTFTYEHVTWDTGHVYATCRWERTTPNGSMLDLTLTGWASVVINVGGKIKVGAYISGLSDTAHNAKMQAHFEKFI